MDLPVTPPPAPSRRSLRPGPPLIAVLLAVATLGAECPNQDPLAVAECGPARVGPGESVALSATGSVDPDRDRLSFRWELGDGSTASGAELLHAYARAGTYTPTVVADDGRGGTDRSSCTVLVGARPTGTGPIRSLDFRPVYVDPAIGEIGARPEHGGMIWAFFQATEAWTVEDVRVNGIDSSRGDAPVDWCDVPRTELAAGEIGILRCHTSRVGFDAGDVVRIGAVGGGELLWSLTAPLPAPDVTPSLITATPDGQAVLVHVRNDASEPRRLTGLELEGLDVSDFVTISNALLEPGETGIVTLPMPEGVPELEWMVFTVVAGSVEADPVRIERTRTLRLFRPTFGIGTWTQQSGGGPESPFDSPEVLAQHRLRGVDTLLWGPGPGAPPETVLPLAESEDLYLFTHMGRPPLDFSLEHSDHPRLIGNAIAGEPEFGDGNLLETVEKYQDARDVFGAPLWVYNACAFSFSQFAPIADIAGMDHYAIWAPKCNTLDPPIGVGDRIEATGLYADAIRQAAEPLPVWNWTQGLNDNVRCPSANEIRTQWYQVLGRGSKTLHWFLYRTEKEEACPEASALELRRVADELAALEEVVLTGDVASHGSVASSPAAGLDVTATVAPRGIFVAITDFDYEPRWFDPAGHRWSPRTNVPVELRLPAGFEPLRALLVDGASRTELPLTPVAEREWRLTVPRFTAAAAVLVEREP